MALQPAADLLILTILFDYFKGKNRKIEGRRRERKARHNSEGQKHQGRTANEEGHSKGRDVKATRITPL